MVAIFYMMKGVGIVLLIHCPNIYVFYICGLIIFVGGGGAETGQSVWLMEMWQEKCAPILQMVRFTQGLGSIAAPFIVRPFLSGILKNVTVSETKNSTNFTNESSLNFKFTGEDG